MKKLWLCAAGIAMALAFGACTPTQVTETQPHVAGRSNPQGLTPEMVKGEAEKLAEKTPDPNAPTLAMAFLYYPNSDGTKLVRELVDLEVLSEETLAACLIEKGVFGEGVEVMAFGIEGGEKAGPGVEASSADAERTGVLDLSQALEGDAKQEKLALEAIANTFIENYELDKLRILVNGEDYSSANTTMGEEDYLIFTDNFEEG